jgi:hypothetical protein
VLGTVGTFFAIMGLSFYLYFAHEAMERANHQQHAADTIIFKKNLHGVNLII